jgi:hypothetical protein
MYLSQIEVTGGDPQLCFRRHTARGHLPRYMTFTRRGSLRAGGMIREIVNHEIAT